MLPSVPKFSAKVLEKHQQRSRQKSQVQIFMYATSNFVKNILSHKHSLRTSTVNIKVVVSENQLRDCYGTELDQNNF